MASENNYDQNIEELMQAGQFKLEQEKKRQEEENRKNIEKQVAGGQDIYADLRSEQDDDVDYPAPAISHRPEGLNEPDIAYRPANIPEDYELSNGDMPIFEGGPGITQVDIWKKQFTNEKVYHVKILEKHFIFRTLNRYEYKQIVAIENVDALYREEVICHTCVLWPYNYDFKNMAVEDSGYPSTLASVIMENSGFTQNYGIEEL